MNSFEITYFYYCELQKSFCRIKMTKYKNIFSYLYSFFSYTGKIVKNSLHDLGGSCIQIQNNDSENFDN